MTCTEEYREHIEYTFHAFCKVVIRNATINAARTRSRKHKREISLEYLTDEKHYPLGTTDEYFQAPEPDEEYILTLCGDTVIFSSGLLAEALSRLDEREREMIYLSFFKRIPQHEIGRQYGRDTAHYVDSIGYRQTPEFLQPQNYLKHVEDIVEQNDNNFDGIINNTPQTPTVGELEQKAKAGEPISLIDLADAIHADKERGKEEKPSIRAQLRAAKEQTARRKAQRSKTQDLERN